MAPNLAVEEIAEIHRDALADADVSGATPVGHRVAQHQGTMRGEECRLLGFGPIPHEKKPVAGKGGDVGAVVVGNIEQHCEAII
jgi:hypothetical protein